MLSKAKHLNVRTGLGSPEILRFAQEDMVVENG